jgi:hypothetical protein
LIDLVSRVATAHGATPAQVENIGATDLHLSPDGLTLLSGAATRLGVAGTGYDQAMQELTGR